VFYWILLDFNVVIFKQPADSLSMGFLPHFPFFFLGHLVALIHVAVAAVAEGCNPVVMGF